MERKSIYLCLAHMSEALIACGVKPGDEVLVLGKKMEYAGEVI